MLFPSLVWSLAGVYQLSLESKPLAGDAVSTAGGTAARQEGSEGYCGGVRWGCWLGTRLRPKPWGEGLVSSGKPLFRSSAAAQLLSSTSPLLL